VCSSDLDGPALVVAGAGTGKTSVIVERIIRLITSGVQPEQILALTFTEKAAAEMRDRVAEASLTASLDTTIATFNGFGNDLLKQYGNEWGLSDMRLLGETGQLVFLREHFDELQLDYFAPVSNPDGQLSALRDYASTLKQQLVAPETYTAYANGLPASDAAEALDKKKHQELARFYDSYITLCRKQQMIDYDDQIYLAVQLLQARPNVLRTLQSRYRYILVDEFQDTNPMQSALVDLLAADHQNLMVVGDDDQSIYGWRGATLANILDFSKRYPAAQNITLIENYRSTQQILDAAYRLIQNNNPERLEVINKLDKRLHGQSKGDAPSLQHFYSFEAELTWLAENIAHRLANGQDPEQIAVLARGRQSAQRVHEALELHGVEHAISGQKSNLYRQSVVQQLIELLKTVSNPTNNTALFHALSGPAFTLPAQELAALAAQAHAEHSSLHDAIAASGSEPFTAALASLSDWREQTKQLSVGNLAYAIITDSGWKQRLYNDAQQDAEAYVQAQALSE
jgi:DNA helicase-2/ATP-dependent DNA helicase PcrA